MTRDHDGSALRCLAVWACATTATAVLVPRGLDDVGLLIHAPPHAFEDLLASLAGAALAAALAWLWITTTWTVADVLRGRPPRPGAGLTRRLVLLACGVATIGAAPGAYAAERPAAPDTQVATGSVIAGLPLPERAGGAATHVGTGARAGEQATAPPSAPPPSAAPPQRAPDPARTGAAGPGAEGSGAKGSGGQGSGAQGSRGQGSGVAHGQVAGDRHVVVEGDSLWDIAADLLPATSSPADVDAFWRAIHRANRAVVGADPDVIHAGQVLHLPRPREGR